MTDLADRPMIILRFNPDKCKINKKEWNTRITKLKERIQYWKINIPNDLITIEYLFY